MAKYKMPNMRQNERLQAQAAHARTSGPFRRRCGLKAPQLELARQLRAARDPHPVGETCAWCLNWYGGKWMPGRVERPHPKPEETKRR